MAETTKSSTPIKPRPKLTFGQWILTLVFAAILLFGLHLAGIFDIPSFDTSNKIDSTAPTNGVNTNPTKGTDNNTVSGKPVAPSGNTNTQKAFYKIDSAECKIYKEVSKVGYVDIYTMIVGSGSAGGPVGSLFTIGSNPLYGTDSNLVAETSCSAWTRVVNQRGDSYSCIREPGQPFTTTWTMINQGPRYASSIGRERTIYLMGGLDDGEGTGVRVNNPFAFQCLTDNGY